MNWLCPEMVLGRVFMDLITGDEEMRAKMEADELRWKGGCKVMNLEKFEIKYLTVGSYPIPKTRTTLYLSHVRLNNLISYLILVRSSSPCLRIVYVKGNLYQI